MPFVIKTQQMLGMPGKGGDMVSVGDSFLLRESHGSYGVKFTHENRPIALENAHYWDDYP